MVSLGWLVRYKKRLINGPLAGQSSEGRSRLSSVHPEEARGGRGAVCLLGAVIARRGLMCVCDGRLLIRSHLRACLDGDLADGPRGVVADREVRGVQALDQGGQVLGQQRQQRPVAGLVMMAHTERDGQAGTGAVVDGTPVCRVCVLAGCPTLAQSPTSAKALCRTSSAGSLMLAYRSAASCSVAPLSSASNDGPRPSAMPARPGKQGEARGVRRAARKRGGGRGLRCVLPVSRSSAQMQKSLSASCLFCSERRDERQQPRERRQPPVVLSLQAK